MIPKRTRSAPAIATENSTAMPSRKASSKTVPSAPMPIAEDQPSPETTIRRHDPYSAKVISTLEQENLVKSQPNPQVEVVSTSILKEYRLQRNGH